MGILLYSDGEIRRGTLLVEAVVSARRRRDDAVMGVYRMSLLLMSSQRSVRYIKHVLAADGLSVD